MVVKDELVKLSPAAPLGKADSVRMQHGCRRFVPTCGKKAQDRTRGPEAAPLKAPEKCYTLQRRRASEPPHQTSKPAGGR